MKKISLLFILAFCSMMTTKAQIPDGFYHIKNADTGRYLSLNDTNPENYPVNKTSGSVNLAGIRTYLNYDSVSVSPSCVIFIRSLGNGQYDLAGQGSSFYEMTSHKLPIDIKEVSNGVYILSGTHSGFTKELMDRSPSDEDGYIMGSGSSGMNRWNFTLEEIKDEVIPFATPVIIRCNSANPEDNKIEPVIGGYDVIENNWLGGVYCSLVGVAGHTNVTPYNPSTMRVLGLDSKGDIAFINAKDRPELLVTDRYGAQYLRGNKAYLKVNPGDADVMTIGGTGIKDIKSVTSASGSIYTLTGVRLPEGITPKSGVYIKDGKKKIIK